MRYSRYRLAQEESMADISNEAADAVIEVFEEFGLGNLARDNLSDAVTLVAEVAQARLRTIEGHHTVREKMEKFK